VKSQEIADGKLPLALGKVFLVGAGPGDPGLVVLRGIAALVRADVVVYDNLVAPELLAYVRPEATLVNAGKTAGSHTMSQREISRRLIDEARAGRMVVRLKGGDPFVFGRGGEEALELADAGVDFEVVPGVTAGIAAAAYAGIPATLRGVASSVILVTGHEADGKEAASVDWRCVAAAGGTLIVYMGVGRLADIAEKIAAVRGGGTPCAVIRWGATARQQTVVGTLDDIAALAKAAGVRPPAVLVAGDVVNLRGRISWFEKRPLFGKRVLIPRTRGAAGALAESIRALGGRPLVVPAIEVRQVDQTPDLVEALDRLGRYDWVLFTSANAVEALWRRLVERGGDARAFGSARVGAIGAATRTALAEHGIAADFTPTEALTEAFGRELIAAHPVEGKSFLLPRATGAGRTLPAELRKHRAAVKCVALYETVICEDSRAEMGSIVAEGVDAVLYTSPSVVRAVVELAGTPRWDALQSALSISIGPVTSRALRDAGLEVAAEARNHDAGGLLHTLVENSSREGTPG